MVFWVYWTSVRRTVDCANTQSNQFTTENWSLTWGRWSKWSLERNLGKGSVSSFPINLRKFDSRMMLFVCTTLGRMYIYLLIWISNFLKPDIRWVEISTTPKPVGKFFPTIGSQMTTHPVKRNVWTNEVKFLPFPYKYVHAGLDDAR